MFPIRGRALACPDSFFVIVFEQLLQYLRTDKGHSLNDNLTLHFLPSDLSEICE